MRRSGIRPTAMIINLLNQIKNEEIVLPAIQRNFVWPENKVLRLLDSIMRGYPIGIALLWKTYLDLQYRRFNEAFHSGEIHDFKENRRRRKLKFLVTRRCACGTLYRLRWCNQHRTPGAKSLRHFCVSLLLTSRGY
jgi:hypothetical protein